MKQQFTEIDYENSRDGEYHFDIVKFEDILKKKPTDHSQFEFHKVSFYVILLLTENNGMHNINFNDYSFKKGTIFTLRKDSIHKFYKSNAKGFLLVFKEKFILSQSTKLGISKVFLLFNELLTSPKVQLNKDEFEDILALINLMQKEYLNINDKYSSIIIRSLFQAIFTKLFRIKSMSNNYFENNKHLATFSNFQKLVERDCFKSRKVNYYSDKMEVSSKTLNNITQSIVRKSAKSFINDITIMKAQQMIINSEDSLIKISHLAGFDEPTNFFKYFKKYSGTSPSKFRDKE